MQSLCARALCLCLTFAALVSVASGRELYVRPNATSVCPGEPCLTLDEYMEYNDTYITSNTVFKLLPGQHNLTRSFVVRDVVNISIEGRLEASTMQPVIHLIDRDINIATLNFFNATNVSVRGVKMLQTYAHSYDSRALYFQHGSNLLVADVDIVSNFQRMDCM